MMRKTELPSASDYQVRGQKVIVKNPPASGPEGCPCRRKPLRRLIEAGGPCPATLCPLPLNQQNCPQPYLGDDPVCPVGSLGARINGPDFNGDFELMPGLVVSLSSLDGLTVDWSANRPGVTAITVQSGANQYTYSYSADETGGTGLHAPLDVSCTVPTIHHLDICFNISTVTLFGLDVLKTADTRYQKKFNWSITKVANKATVSLALGQQTTVDYIVSGGFTEIDQNWEVFGSITATNTNDDSLLGPILLDGVSDLIPGGTVTVTSPVNFPYPLSNGESVTFDYVAVMNGPGAGTNTALVEAHVGTDSHVFVALNDWDFLVPASIELIDECITISDSLQGSGLAAFCATNNNPRVFSYSRVVGPYETCGDHTVANTASFETNDTGTFGSASWSVLSVVACPPEHEGCTSGKSYWTRHAGQGKQPYDPTWNLLPGGLRTSTIFFTSGKTYYQILKTDPGTNSYYILAQQYIATQLNLLRGASGTQIQTAYDQALNFFLTTTPGQVANKKGNDPVRKLLTQLTDALRDYNKGKVGPGKCRKNNGRGSH